MREVYYGEKWAGNWDNNFAGFRDKANLCFEIIISSITFPTALHPEPTVVANDIGKAKAPV